jgi:hypothetical protein
MANADITYTKIKTVDDNNKSLAKFNHFIEPKPPKYFFSF